MQTFVPLHLVTVGVGVAWLVRSFTVNSAPKSKGPVEPGDGAPEGCRDADLERSATQWLARSGTEHSSPRSPVVAVPRSSSYAELEVLADGDFVYLRLGGSVLTALVPTVRHLTLQPLQLVKGNQDAVPTAPLEAISVWLVRRWKQQVAFELLGPHDRRHVLEADPDAPHGVALGGGSPGKRGRWLITPQGLASARYPTQILPLQVCTVQFFDARAVKSVRDGLGLKLAELGTKLRHEERTRAQAEGEREKLEAALKRVRNETESQIAELRAQLEAALIARHTAEREVVALQAQKADEAARTKMVMARATQAEFEAEQAEASVRRQQQQIQGMLAVHAEELRTLQQELHIAREANEGLQRAMREQNMSMKGALELRDARILELEEENDRMDTVLQVIQAQLGGGLAFPERRVSVPGVLASEPAEAAESCTAVERMDGTAANLENAGTAGAGRSDRGEEEDVEQNPPAAVAVPPGDEPPLWRSLLDLTGDLSVTALKESLAISRRNTVEDAPLPSGEAHQSPYADAGNNAHFGLPSGGVDLNPGCQRDSNPGEARDVAGDWGSGGGGGVDGAPAYEEEFISAADRMSGRLRPPSAAVTPLRRQPQVPGAAAGGGVGFPSAMQTHPAGAGANANAAARRGSFGDPVDLAAAAMAALDGAAPGGAGCTAAAAATGPSPADLEYGMEATLTLDSLKWRMRQLEAERERLELLRFSLEESLPWRVSISTGGGATCSSRLAFCTQRLGAGGGRAAAEADDMTAAAARTEEEEEDQEGEKQLDQHKHSRRKQVDDQHPRQHLEHKQFTGKHGGIGQDLQARAAKEPMEGRRTGEQQSRAQAHEGQEASPPARQHVSDQQGGISAHRSAAHKGPRAVCGVPFGAANATGAVALDVVTGCQRQTEGGTIARGSFAIASSDRRPPCKSAGGSGSHVSGARGFPAFSPELGPRVRCVTGQQQQQPPGSGIIDSSGEAPRGCPALRCTTTAPVSSWNCAVDTEDSGTSSCCSSDGLSACGASMHRQPEGEVRGGDAEADVGSAAAGHGAGSATAAAACGAQAASRTEPACEPSASLVAKGEVGRLVAEDEGDGLAAGEALLAPAGALGGAIFGSATPAGLRLPGLIIGGGSPAADLPYGVLDSIDGLCNLGSTRVPASVLGGGWQTARRVEHSRQPSAGVTVDAAPWGAAAPAQVAALASCSPGTLVTPRPAVGPPGAATTPASAKGVATPMSCESTMGGCDFDEGVVHCDELEVSRSPPPAMLLGPLDQLRGAAAAAAAAMAPGGSSSGGARVRSALGHDDDED